MQCVDKCYQNEKELDFLTTRQLCFHFNLLKIDRV